MSTFRKRKVLRCFPDFFLHDFESKAMVVIRRANPLVFIKERRNLLINTHSLSTRRPKL
jgi:hypothetical protein